mgnify:CR=1 FL=1
MNEQIIDSSANLFADLGFEPGEAAILSMRAKLMTDLRLWFGNSKLTQSEAAKVLGVSQSRVSDLVNGRWEEFSLEMLILLEAKVGRRVALEFVE